MKRFGVIVVVALAVLTAAAEGAKAAPYTADEAVKINVMGEWAHPDDDTSIIGPCGVWHQRYDVRCGIIMVTRGEGGGNATGTEIGPELGLRRENEDRVAHYRSGTIDIFNIDSVDFFYNTSAPLTQYFWGTETLRRITRIIRMTQPDIYVGFTPSLNAGHGNHQQAGRYIWEGVKAAADPNMFPEQLTGPNALSTWQVKKVFSGGSTAPAPPQGQRPDAADCTTGFTPPRPTWTRSRASGRAMRRRSRGRPATSRASPPDMPKIWAQVASEGASAYPTQSRVMYQGTATAGCSRFGMTDSFVPFQPNVNADGTTNAAAGRDDAILYGAMRRRPRRTAAGHAAIPHVLAVPQHAGDAVRGDGQHAFGRRGDRGRNGRADRSGGLERRRPEADRHGHRRQPRDRHVHDHAAGERDGQPDVQDRRPLHGRRRDRLHRRHDPARLGGRGSLRALGQVGRIRRLAARHGARRVPDRPLGGDPDHGRG